MSLHSIGRRAEGGRGKGRKDEGERMKDERMKDERTEAAGGSLAVSQPPSPSLPLDNILTRSIIQHKGEP
jgi:hypothetical protein